MTVQSNAAHKEVESPGRVNKTMYRLTSVLGLTTGVGVIAWGVWSLFATVATFVWEETEVVQTNEILVNAGFNEGLLLSAVVIALGVVILELKRIQQLLAMSDDRSIKDDGSL